MRLKAIRDGARWALLGRQFQTTAATTQKALFLVSARCANWLAKHREPPRLNILHWWLNAHHGCLWGKVKAFGVFFISEKKAAKRNYLSSIQHYARYREKVELFLPSSNIRTRSHPMKLLSSGYKTDRRRWCFTQRTKLVEHVAIEYGNDHQNTVDGIKWRLHSLMKIQFINGY